MAATPRTKRCPETVRAGRVTKARQFWAAAERMNESAGDGSDLADAFVTLCVHAGIAAADAVCCTRLGEHAQGQSHSEAVGLLRKVDPKLARQLDTLLGLKTRAGYSAQPMTAANRRQAERAVAALLEAVDYLA